MNSTRATRALAVTALLALALAAAGCGTRQTRAQVISGLSAPVTATAQQVGTSDGGISGPATGATGPGAVTATRGAIPRGGTTGSTVAVPVGPASRGSAAGGTTGAGTGAAVPAGCTKQLSPITIGQVGGFTGLVSNTLAGGKVGMQVWVKATNAKGGVACHPIVLQQRDDASDASKSNAAVRDLVENGHAVALVGSAVPISISGFRAGVEAEKVPAVGGDSLNPDWNESPYLFPQGTTFGATIIGAAKQNADRGKRKIGLVYCLEASNCTDAYQVLKNGGAKKAGATVVYEAQISITSTDYSAQCQGARSAGADQLLLAMDGSAIQRFARSCAALGYYPAITTSAIATGSVVTSDPNVQRMTLSVAHIVFPWMRADTPAQKAYQDAMRTYAPDTPSDGSTSQAWVAGEMFRAAVEKLGPEASGDITTAKVLKGLALLKGETLGGLTTQFSITAGQSHAPENNCYFPVLLTKGWSSPSSKPICL
jgi:branched-chain amino acid transport system substrate-binding protein